MSRIGASLAALTLGLYALLLVAMGLAPEKMGAPVVPESGWTWLLVAVVALFLVQVGAVILYAATDAEDPA